MPDPNPDPPTVALLTLGCAKNLVDSEQIASILEQQGVRVTHSTEGARVAVVNTCGFVAAAKEEAIDLILEVGEGKGAGDLRTLIVTGCLGQRYGDELTGLLPEVDAVVGVDPQETARLALKGLGLPVAPLVSEVMLRTRRMTPRAWSYLRISRGCDNRCSYCAIPLIRGPLRSRPYEDLIEEARLLAGQGVRELNVIAQDTASYGRDLYGRTRIHELVRDLCSIDELAWVRLLYLHPAHVTDELIEVMGGQQKVCAYADLPLQHINDDVLRGMGRRCTRAEAEGVIARLRGGIPGLTLRTTFMTGFPGETDAHFDELLRFVEETRFDRLGCFAYSPEEGTPAAGRPDQVPEELRQERYERLMSLQQEIAFDLAEERVGEEATVLMEEGEPTEDGLRPARGCAEAPDVDPLVLVAGEAPAAGEFAEVRVVEALGYDCVAEVREPR